MISSTAIMQADSMMAGPAFCGNGLTRRGRQRTISEFKEECADDVEFLARVKSFLDFQRRCLESQYGCLQGFLRADGTVIAPDGWVQPTPPTDREAYESLPKWIIANLLAGKPQFDVTSIGVKRHNNILNDRTTDPSSS